MPKSTLIGVEGEGRWGAMMLQAKAMLTLKTAKWHPLVPFSDHTKQLNPRSNSPASDMVYYSQLSAFPGKMEPFKDQPCSY